MDAIAKWGSALIVLINTIFGIIALVFIVAGCLVKYAADKVDAIAGSAISAAKTNLPDKATNYIDVDNFKVSEFVGEAYVAFIVTGVILLSIVVWAYCGTCCKSKWMLIIYAVILTLIILAQVAFVILLTTNRTVIDDAVKDALMKTLKLYKGGLGKDAPSRVWNAIMGILDCCGVDGADDFSSLTGWTRYMIINTTGTPDNITMQAPYICCKNQSSTCPDQKYNDTNEFKEGCFDAFCDLVNSNKAMAIGVSSGLGVFEVVLWFLTVWLIKELQKKKRQVTPKEN